VTTCCILDTSSTILGSRARLVVFAMEFGHADIGLSVLLSLLPYSSPLKFENSASPLPQDLNFNRKTFVLSRLQKDYLQQQQQHTVRHTSPRHSTMTRSWSLLLTATLALALAAQAEHAQAFVPHAAVSAPSFATRAAPVSSSLHAESSQGQGQENESESKPLGIIVQATIEPDRMAEFMELMQTNAENSRKEPGCLRFDVLRSQTASNEFCFYELYQNAAAIDFHKAQPHYNLWADFKASGGTITSVSQKMDGEFIS
jgi:autoinducer 2-degrading protein